MVISEIFHSIQGESTRAGLPCVFVRLTGCNLRCTWCDTAYAFHGGEKLTVDEVVTSVGELSGRAATLQSHAPGDWTSLVELTGGEPLLQPEAVPLAERLIGEGYQVLIETSGERHVGGLPREVIKIVDVKCPDSGAADTFCLENLDALDGKDEVKFVISSRRDYEFAREFIRRHELARRVHQVLLSPVFPDPNGSWSGLSAQTLSEWILADRLPVRLGLQLHKFIWHPAAKGV